MEIYFIRHGIAVDQLDSSVNNDEERWLTEEGIKKMEKTAAGFVKLVNRLDRIYSSPLVRARQTAEIIQNALPEKTTLEITSKLECGAHLESIIPLLGDVPVSSKVALVGHEPDFSSMISALISNGSAWVEMKKGAICRVDMPGKPKKGTGMLVWLLPSKVLRLLV